jgi:DNA-dependent RNA polymerase auxiliary subunit epsilon
VPIKIFDQKKKQTVQENEPTQKQYNNIKTLSKGSRKKLEEHTGTIAKT